VSSETKNRITAHRTISLFHCEFIPRVGEIFPFQRKSSLPKRHSFVYSFFLSELHKKKGMDREREEVWRLKEATGQIKNHTIIIEK
jgi:hypothetical protein